jgi:glucose/arabinose dehydrogenase
VIRINRDGTAPSDNPFWDGNMNANRSKVWALGARNMFRFTFRPGTNTMFAGDVGWNLWEEINVVTAGNNLGWPCYE